MIAKRCFDFALGQRGGGLIHDQNVGFKGDRLGNLHDLPIGNRKIPNLDVRIDVNIQAAKQMLGHSPHLGMIHKVHKSEALHRLAPNPNVFGHGHVRHQVQFW